VPRVSLPFQIIERINESRATREAANAHGIFRSSTSTRAPRAPLRDGWRNKLIWGDNLLVMGSLLERFAGKIDLIYNRPAVRDRGRLPRFVLSSATRRLQRSPRSLRKGIQRHVGPRGSNRSFRCFLIAFNSCGLAVSNRLDLRSHGWDVSH